MKYLKLDAQFEGARKLAECLIGSPTIEVAPIIGIRDVGTSFSFVLNNNMRFSVISLPLDTLKLCPFMAMKNHINVLSYMSYMEGFGLVGGLIAKIQYSSHIHDVSLQICKDGLWYDCNFDNVTLDFEKLPEGCEIIEV